MHQTKLIAAMLAAALIAGCSSLPRPFVSPDVSDKSERLATAIDAGTDASLDIEAGFGDQDVFLLRPQEKADPLPKVQMPTISVTESGVYDSMQEIAARAGLSLSIRGGPQAMERHGSASVFSLRGDFADVMEELSRSIGFFYSVRGGVLRVSQEEQFVIDMPPILHEDNLAGLTNTVQYLGGRDVYLDRMNRSLAFRANRTAYDRINDYMAKVRESRSMIVYECKVWQVDLTDTRETGVQWNKFSWNSAGSAAGKTVTLAPSGSSTASLGAVFTGAKFSLDLLLSFLETQGTVKAISQPRIAILSGSRGSLRVGQATTYVSKVGTNITTALNQVTVETKDLQTGFELSLAGEAHDNTVYTRVQLNLSDLVRFNKFTALGTDLTLPQTADREVKTFVRARPGDTILLGGITLSKDSVDVSNGATGTGKTGDVSRSELVLALRPKLVRFTGGKPAEVKAAVEPVNAVAVAQRVEGNKE